MTGSSLTVNLPIIFRSTKTRKPWCFLTLPSLTVCDQSLICYCPLLAWNDHDRLLHLSTCSISFSHYTPDRTIFVRFCTSATSAKTFSSFLLSRQNTNFSACHIRLYLIYFYCGKKHDKIVACTAGAFSSSFTESVSITPFLLSSAPGSHHPTVCF